MVTDKDLLTEVSDWRRLKKKVLLVDIALPLTTFIFITFVEALKIGLLLAFTERTEWFNMLVQDMSVSRVLYIVGTVLFIFFMYWNRKRVKATRWILWTGEPLDKKYEKVGLIGNSKMLEYGEDRLKIIPDDKEYMLLSSMTSNTVYYYKKVK